MKDVFCSLYLFLFLSRFCVLAGVDRHCLGFGVCLKSLPVMCAKDFSQNIHFASGLLSAGFLGTGKNVAEERKNLLLFVLCDVEQVWHPGLLRPLLLN